MKKGLFGIVVILMSLCLIGCGKKTNETKWTTDIAKGSVGLFDEEKKVFADATKENDKEYQAIAVLGTQVVAGTNYMFLATENNESYKILIIYNDLEGYSKLTKVLDFDYTQYVSKDIEYKAEELTGGWSVPFPTEGAQLDGKVAEAFSKTNELVGATYLPIAALGHLGDDNVKYAVLCYGRLATANNDNGIFLLTLGDGKVLSIAYIDLAAFNK